MRKFLLVGDPHVTPDALDDFRALMGLVRKAAGETGARVVFLGDQHHTHAMIRVEVMHAWYNELCSWKGESPIMLVGNHDVPGTEAPVDMHALLPYRQFADVVQSPCFLDGVAFMPYFRDPAKFDAAVRELAREKKSPVLICHQTFVGAMYENNFPAPDGVQLDGVPFEAVYSGHIHLPQKMGKLTYVGSPRWRTVSDANIARSLLLIELDDAGNVVSEKNFETEGVCKPIYRFTVSPASVEATGPLEAIVNVGKGERARIIVDVEGPSAFCDEVLSRLPKGDPRYEVRVQREESARAEVRESEGIAGSLRKYIQTGEWGVDKEELWKEVSKRTGLALS